jgi:hypothetical protein
MTDSAVKEGQPQKLRATQTPHALPRRAWSSSNVVPLLFL